MSHRTDSLMIGLLCLILATAWIAPRSEPMGTPGDFNNLDSYITTAMHRYNVPGIALALTQGDRITYSQGYGTSGDGRSVTTDMPFYIGSQSKSFTAVAIMQLVEQGKLKLDAPVQIYLPWFRVADEQASGQITIRNLLQHTSGLSESGYVEHFPPDTSLETIVRDLVHAHLTAPVGTKMQYFNPGYSTLGLLIETVSGQSYGEFLSEHIFVPLKMGHSFTDPLKAEAAGLAQG